MFTQSNWRNFLDDLFLNTLYFSIPKVMVRLRSLISSTEIVNRSLATGRFNMPVKRPNEIRGHMLHYTIPPSGTGPYKKSSIYRRKRWGVSLTVIYRTKSALFLTTSIFSNVLFNNASKFDPLCVITWS